jgi:plasmid stabilization system protein ParE
MIVWSPLASKDYEENIEFLLQRWTTKEAIHFIEVTDSVLNIIEKVPMTFRSTGYKDIRAAVIVPQITLYYQLLDNGDVSLIRFWNNYQDPTKLKLGG